MQKKLADFERFRTYEYQDHREEMAYSTYLTTPTKRN